MLGKIEMKILMLGKTESTIFMLGKTKMRILMHRKNKMVSLIVGKTKLRFFMLCKTETWRQGRLCSCDQSRNCGFSSPPTEAYYKGKVRFASSADAVLVIMERCD